MEKVTSTLPTTIHTTLPVVTEDVLLTSSEKVHKVAGAVRTAISAGQLQKVIPVATAALSTEIVGLVGTGLSILGSTFGCVVSFLNLRQKNKFLMGLECLQKNQFPNKEAKQAFIDLVKSPGNLEKILSPDFCKKNNIYIDLFINAKNGLKALSAEKIILIQKQAKLKRIMDIISLFIAITSLAISIASLATPIPVWVVYYLPTILFALNYIIEQQFVDHDRISLSNFLPTFIHDFANEQVFLKIDNLADYYASNKARLGLYLTKEEIQECDQKLADIKKNIYNYSQYNIIEEQKKEFSKHLRKKLQLKVKKDKIEMVGLGFAGVAGSLALIPAPILIVAIAPILALGVALYLKPSWFSSDLKKTPIQPSPSAWQFVKGFGDADI